MRRLLLLPLLAGIAWAQAPVANPGFEQGESDGVPTGWRFPPAVAQAGFGVHVSDRDCHSGAHCAMLTGAVNPSANVFGNLMQVVPASGYTLRRIRLRAAIRVEGPRSRAQMWLRLDRADNSMAFLENMGSRPVMSSEWKTYDIETDVPEDVARLVLGVMVFGPGTAWVDDVSIEAIGEIHKDSVESPRPVTEQGLANLTAFTRLYGYVRFFHPSDGAAKTDWETFAVEGVRKVEGAASPAELAERLQELFQPIAPLVRVFPTKKPPKMPDVVAGPDVVRYKHIGVGLQTSATYLGNPYKSEIVRKKYSGEKLPAAFEAVLLPGITATVPLALYADSEGTLPHAKLPEPPAIYERSSADRATRLAAVMIAWNVFQHFYPYFDVVKTDWNAELPKALRRAATDAGVDDFHKTLQLLVAALKDGHGDVMSPNQKGRLQPPVTLDWIGGQFVVTRVQTGKAEGISPGDRILKIDGKPVEEAAAEAEALIGASRQWIQYRSPD